MMAAIAAAGRGAQVTLIEPNERLGKTEYHGKRTLQRHQQLYGGGASAKYPP